MRLLLTATATGASAGSSFIASTKTFQASGSTTAGAGAATVAMQGTVDGTSWDTFGTITLTLGTAATSDSFVSSDAYSQIRANITALSGTGAAVIVTAGF